MEMVGLDAVHIGKWWGWVQSQDMDKGVGMDRDRKDSLQQLGADEHKSIMHQLESHR